MKKYFKESLNYSDIRNSVKFKKSSNYVTQISICYNLNCEILTSVHLKLRSFLAIFTFSAVNNGKQKSFAHSLE